MSDEPLNAAIKRMQETLEDMRAAKVGEEVIQRYEALIHQAKIAALEVADSGSDAAKRSVEEAQAEPDPAKSPRDRTDVDPAYAALDPADVPLYQRYFEKCLEAVDVDNYTKHTTYEPCDKARMKRDDETLERILREEAGEKAGLLPPMLQIMLYQYFAADVTARRRDKQRWVERVMYPEPKLNYFPTPRAVLRAFFK